MRRGKLITAAAAAVLIGAGILMPASPAAAAAPQCTHAGVWSGLRVPLSASGSTSCVMGQGAVSSAVQVLQTTMNACHGQNISADSDFGPKTRSALIRVQRNVGADDDGVYGPETFGKMARKGGFVAVWGTCTVLL